MLSEVKGDPDIVNKSGILSLGIGGSGYNIAVNIASEGFGVNFLTAMSRSIISGTIVDSVQNAGVDPYIYYQDDLSESGFSAHLVQGEVLSSVSSSPVEKIDIPDDIVARAIENVKVVVADFNMSLGVLGKLAFQAQKKDVPFCLIGVSQEKSFKILSLCSNKFIVDLFFTDRAELDYLKERAGEKGQPDSDFISSHIMSWVVVFESSNTVSVFKSDGTKCVLPEDATSKSRATKLLGAKEMLLAKTLCRIFKNKMSLVNAVSASVPETSKIILAKHQSKKNKNPLEEHYRNISAQALSDNLTKLYNRYAFIRQASAKSERKDCAVLMFDIDHFKNINDTYGHDAGDDVLRKMGLIIKDVFRNRDVCARWGGEEFMVLLDDVQDEHCIEMLGERIRGKIQEADFPCGRVTISVGGTVVFCGEDIDAGIKRADDALYKAKDNGRNKMFFSDMRLYFKSDRLEIS